MCIVAGTGIGTDDCVQCPVCCLILCAKSSDAAAQVEAAAAQLSDEEKAQLPSPGHDKADATDATDRG